MKSAALLPALVLVVLGLSGCGETWTKLPVYSVGEQLVPPVVSETPGTGAKVRVGDLVEVDVEIIEPSTVFAKESSRGQKRRAWIWVGAATTKGAEFGSESTRRLLEGRRVATEMVLDAKTPIPTQKGPPLYGAAPWVLDRPLADHRSSIIVYDTVHRIRILRACPAEAWEAKSSSTKFGFNSGCKGDFIPTSCSPSLWKTSTLYRYRITASCGDEKLDFQTPEA